MRKIGHRERVAAVGLWTLSGDWSADNLTDGFVPWEVVEDWDPQHKLAARLIEVGLWTETEYDGELGILFHDWDDWQPTREQVTQRRKADAERRARWREARRNAKAAAAVTANTTGESPEASRNESRRDTLWDTEQDSQGGSRGESRDESALPKGRVGSGRVNPPLPSPPVRPSDEPSDEEPSSSASRKRPATRLPASWRPTDNHRRYAAEHDLELDTQRQLFVAHAEANDRRCSVWNSAFTQWLIKADEIQRRNGGRHLHAVGGHQAFRNRDQAEFDGPDAWGTP